MQIGESIAVCSAPKGKDSIFDAVMDEVDFGAGVKTLLRKASPERPHWRRSNSSSLKAKWSKPAARLGLPAEPYSTRPVVFALDDPPKKIKVKLKVTRSLGVSGQGTLIGRAGGLLVKGKCSTGAGIQAAELDVVEYPKMLSRYCGDMAWGIELDEPGTTQVLGPSFVEVLFVFSKPKTSALAKGVPIEVLRWLMQKVCVSGALTEPEATARIARFCHTMHGLTYDTRRGAPRYAKKIDARNLAVIEFPLVRYCERSSATVNCYDQATAVQALSAAIGVTMAWIFLQPFGYIKPLQLVGVPGLCNNPFFKSNHSSALVAADDPMRTAFGNHAFVADDRTKIFDACAGPQAGTKDPTEYLEAAIDRTPSLYRGASLPGTVDMAVKGQGLTSLK